MTTNERKRRLIYNTRAQFYLQNLNSSETTMSNQEGSDNQDNTKGRYGTPCKHKCRAKEACAHQCCKEGAGSPRVTKRKNPESDVDTREESGEVKETKDAMAMLAAAMSAQTKLLAQKKIAEQALEMPRRGH